MPWTFFITISSIETYLIEFVKYCLQKKHPLNSDWTRWYYFNDEPILGRLADQGCFIRHSRRLLEVGWDLMAHLKARMPKVCNWLQHKSCQFFDARHGHFASKNYARRGILLSILKLINWCHVWHHFSMPCLVSKSWQPSDNAAINCPHSANEHSFFHIQIWMLSMAPQVKTRSWQVGI